MKLEDILSVRCHIEPEHELTLHVSEFQHCRSKFEANLLVLRKLRAAGFRLASDHNVAPDFLTHTSADGQTITLVQWPQGSLRKFEQGEGADNDD